MYKKPRCNSFRIEDNTVPHLPDRSGRRDSARSYWNVDHCNASGLVLLPKCISVLVRSPI